MNEMRRQMLHDVETLQTIRQLYNGSLLTDGVLANLLGTEPGKFVFPQAPVAEPEKEETGKKVKRGRSTSKSAEYNRKYRARKKAEAEAEAAVSASDNAVVGDVATAAEEPVGNEGSDEPAQETAEGEIPKELRPPEDAPEEAAVPKEPEKSASAVPMTKSAAERRKPGRKPGKLDPQKKKTEGDVVIDVGKVMALRRAGWSIKDISSDMHLEPDVIRRVFAESR